MTKHIRSFPSGYSTPLSPSGDCSVVLPPPWVFGTDGMHVRLEVDPSIFVDYLPPGLEPSDEPGLVEVAFCEMASVSGAYPLESVEHPERVNFRECLIKMSCSFEGRKGWFVPFTWVDTDFALVRGHIQGFPKRLGAIAATRFSTEHPATGGRRKGATIGACLVTPSGLCIKATHTCQAEAPPERFPAFPFFLLRHFPSVENPLHPSICELVEPVTSESTRRNLWTGPGTLDVFGPDSDERRLLRSATVRHTYSLVSSVTITGARTLHRFAHQEEMANG